MSDSCFSVEKNGGNNPEFVLFEYKKITKKQARKTTLW